MEQNIITYRNGLSYQTEYSVLTEEAILSFYSSQPFKLDKIVKLRRADEKTIKKIISDCKDQYFPYGLYVDGHYLLCEEIHTNSIIDYKEQTISFAALNQFLQRKYQKEYHISFLDDFSLFDTESKYYDGEKMIPLVLHNGFHIQERTSKESIREAMKEATNTLYRMLQPSGMIVYGYDVARGLPIPGYNNVRHVGVLWALCLLSDYIVDKNVQKKIKKSFDVIFRHFSTTIGNKLFVFDEYNEDYLLGGNALALLALCEYYQKFHDEACLDTCRKLAMGILSCQQPDGRFYHYYNHQLELKEQDTCVYYDGESVFALLKYYEICHDDIFLEAVSNAFDYFIKKNYQKYLDHWIGYSIREYVKYRYDDKLLQFMNQNCVPFDKNYFSPTRLEAIMAIYQGYCTLKKKKVKSEYLDAFPLEKMIHGIQFMKNSDMNYYIGEEKALYFDYPERSLHAFASADGKFEIRMDMIQHTIAGLYSYLMSDID